MPAAAATRPHPTLSERWRSWVADRELDWVDLLLLLNVLVVTWSKLYWAPFGNLVLANATAPIYIAAFIGSRVRSRDSRLPHSAAIVGGFMLAFAVTFGIGWFGMDTSVERVQFLKGFIQWAIHAGFVVCATAHVARRNRAFFQLVAWTFLMGALVNAVYGILQLAVLVVLHRNLDEIVLTKLTFSVGGSRGIQYYGGGIYRINGLMKDTNHFGVMAAAPLVLAIAWLRGRQRAVVAGILFFALALSLSRSGAVGMVAGLLVLAVPFRRRLVSRGMFVTVALLVVAVFAFTQAFPSLWQSIVVARLDPNGHSAQTHIQLYSLIPQLLVQHPLFGLGLNTFAIHFQDVSGRVEFGPHSYYIELLVESGLVGFTIFVAFAWWLLARAWAAATDPLAIGLAAALVATWAGNAFYLTTQIPYVQVLYALAAAAPVVLGYRLQSTDHARGHRNASPHVPGTRTALPAR